MFAVISTAASGLATESRRIEAAARSIASAGSDGSESGVYPAKGAVRIGSVPYGDPVDSLVTLVEAENAYRLNAAVLGVASDMLGTLLDAFEPRK